MCEKCNKRETRLIEVAEHEAQVCSCGKTMQKIFSRPNILTEKTSSSYIDGQRSKSKAFQELKRQNKLEDIVQDEWAANDEKIEAIKELNTIIKE
jgi:hypothetical protein